MKKWVLVTGASSGIGEVTVKYLDEQGYCVVLVARNYEKLIQISNNLKNESLVIQFDLCELNNIKQIFDTCKTKEIIFDGMVHCAGQGYNVPVRGNIVENMQRIMTINYFAFVELVKFFCMKKYSNDNASIVAISSISPLTCYTGSCNYASSKSALNTAIKVMSKEYIKRKIRINAILPGYVNTPLGPAEDDENYIKQQPLGIIKAEYISYFIEFLLSDKSKYMTATLIPLSGGMNYC